MKPIRQGDMFLRHFTPEVAKKLGLDFEQISKSLSQNKEKRLLKGENSQHEHVLVGGLSALKEVKKIRTSETKTIEVLDIIHGGEVVHRHTEHLGSFPTSHPAVEIPVLPNEQPLWIAYRQLDYRPKGYQQSKD